VTYDSLSISELIPAPPERIYEAWLSSDEHTAFTGDKAVVEPFVGGSHSTLDGYAVGRTVDLQPGRRIVQTWRAEDFPLGSPDSRVEVTLEETVGGTMVTIQHTEIPRGQGSSYRDGWLKYYLEPLKGYFAAAKPNGVPKTPPKATKPRVVAKARAAKKPAKKPPKARRAKAKAKPAAKKPARAKPARANKVRAPKARTTKARAQKSAPARAKKRARKKR
jgi:uncharacterized protein YndB with AHSA1/START domain